MLVFEILGFLWNFKPKNEGYQSISVKMTLDIKYANLITLHKSGVKTEFGDQWSHLSACWVPTKYLKYRPKSQYFDIPASQF